MVATQKNRILSKYLPSVDTSASFVRTTYIALAAQTLENFCMTY